MHSPERSTPWKKRLVLGLTAAAALETGIKHALPEHNSYAERAVAAEQLTETGTTDERRAAYAPGVSEFLFRTVPPNGNGADWVEIATWSLQNLPDGRIAPDNQEYVRESQWKESEHPVRDDGYSLYLGLPQTHDSFAISEYKPTASTEDRYYYAVKGWFDRFFSDNTFFDALSNPKQPRSPNEHLSQLISILESHNEVDQQLARTAREAYELLPSKPYNNIISGYQDDLINRLEQLGEPYGLVEHRTKHGIITDNGLELGRVSLSLGQDERGEYLAYYDRWDFGQPGQMTLTISEDSTWVVGKPYEVYDRLYFDRTQLPIYQPTKNKEVPSGL